MAKTPVAKADPKPEKEPKASLHTYGIKELAEEVGEDQHKIRVVLREMEVEKPGGRYGWDRRAEFDALVKQLKIKFATPSTRGRKKKEDGDDEVKEAAAAKIKENKSTAKAPAVKVPVKKNPIQKRAA